MHSYVHKRTKTESVLPEFEVPSLINSIPFAA